MKKIVFIVAGCLFFQLVTAQTQLPTIIIPTGARIGVSFLQVSQDGKYLLSVSSTDALLWEISSGKPLWSYKVKNKLSGDQARFSPDGKQILTGGLSTRGPGVIASAWDISTKKVVMEIRSNQAYGTELCYSPDGKLIATTGPDGKVGVWDAQTGVRKYAFQAEIGPNDLAFTPDGKSLFMTHYGGEIWDMETGQRISEMLTEHRVPMYIHGCISADGKWIIVSSQNDITVFNGRTQDFFRTFKGHTRHVSSVACSPDNNTFASGSSDGSLKLWDIKSGRMLWDKPMGIPLHAKETDDINENFNGSGGSVNSVVFSPDGRTVYAGLGNRSIRAYDVADGRPTQTFSGPEMNMEFLFYDAAKHEISLRDRTTKGVKRFNFLTAKIENLPPNEDLRWEDIGFKSDDFNFSLQDYQSLMIFDKEDKFLGRMFFLGEKDWYYYNKSHDFECSPGAFDYIFYLDGLKTSKVPASDTRYKKGILRQVFQH